MRSAFHTSVGYVYVHILKKMAVDIAADYPRNRDAAIREAECTFKIRLDGKWIRLGKEARKRLVIEVKKCWHNPLLYKREMSQ